LLKHSRVDREKSAENERYTRKITDSTTLSEGQFNDKDCPFNFYSAIQKHLYDSANFKKIVFRDEILYAYVLHPESSCGFEHVLWIQKYGLIYDDIYGCSTHHPEGFGTDLLKVNGDTVIITPDNLHYL
jgi:hypothetical protein